MNCTAPEQVAAGGSSAASEALPAPSTAEMPCSSGPASKPTTVTEVFAEFKSQLQALGCQPSTYLDHLLLLQEQLKGLAARSGAQSDSPACVELSEAAKVAHAEASTAVELARLSVEEPAIDEHPKSLEN